VITQQLPALVAGERPERRAQHQAAQNPIIWARSPRAAGTALSRT